MTDINRPTNTSISVRPKLHFTPPLGWMNDPNGLVWLDGEYHLFYQHHPHSLRWGPMHWGHAISTDLIHWEHLPIALYPYEKGFVFSGSAVIDHANTAGFGSGAMVAAFTLHTGDGPENQEQAQGIAFSMDRGRTLTMYENNPVIPAPDGIIDSRDPKIFWYGDSEKGHWVMLITVIDEVWLFTSPNLKDWEIASRFGRGIGAHGGVWECPDLFELPIENRPEESRWIMLVSVQDEAPAGGNGVQYFVGTFDGQTFTLDPSQTSTQWMDYGADIYATVTWENEPNGRRIAIGWMNNWAYANTIPATEWRGMLSLPRELTLFDRDKRLVIRQTPISIPIDSTSDSISFENEQISASNRLARTLPSYAAKLELTFDLIKAPTAPHFGICVREGGHEKTIIGYDTEAGLIYIDRSHSGELVPGMVESTRHTAPVELIDGKLSLTIILDLHSIDLFAAEGRTAMTELIFPNPDATGISFFAINGGVILEKAMIRPY